MSGKPCLRSSKQRQSDLQEQYAIRAVAPTPDVKRGVGRVTIHGPLSGAQERHAGLLAQPPVAEDDGVRLPLIINTTPDQRGRNLKLVLRAAEEQKPNVDW